MRVPLLFLCAVASVAVPCVRGMVGANNATFGQFVHQGFIQNSVGQYVCGTWMHSLYWAVAPAHYMRGRPLADTFLVFGTVSRLEGGFQFAVDDIVYHPDFNVETLENNIALLYVAGGMDEYSFMHPIPLATEVTRGGVVVTMAGWYSKEPQMQFLSQRTITNEECRERHSAENRERITEGVICVDTTGGIGGCGCSAGNALVAGDVVIGSFSWTVNCTIGGTPDVYTRISYYRPWIDSVTGNSALDV